MRMRIWLEFQVDLSLITRIYSLISAVTLVFEDVNEEKIWVINASPKGKYVKEIRRKTEGNNKEKWRNQEGNEKEKWRKWEGNEKENSKNLHVRSRVRRRGLHISSSFVVSNHLIKGLKGKQKEIERK